MFPYVVIAGEDDNFGDVLSQIIEKGIDPLRVNFCMLPFGMSNELAQITNWGASAETILKKTVAKTLKDIVQEVKNATINYINVWEIEVTCTVRIPMIVLGRY